MITMSTGKTEEASLQQAFTEKWKTLPKDEFLYRYLLAHTPLQAFNDGLPDEEQKVLKYFGIKYWEPGMEEVNFNGKTYKAINP